MGKIKILPDTLISQIAAGEVVERPASVVKELLENSLDAGARQIMVEVEQGGMKLLAVRDDGYGMTSDDAKMAFARHATSKIATLDDLARIQTFGFRGEALAAIASVSQTTLRTREKTAAAGFEIECRGGKFESEGPAGLPVGTEVVVRNLFFNVPARRKFLKSETTEWGHIMACLSHCAMANPDVGFILKHNGKTHLEAPPNEDERSRIARILGKNLAAELRPVSFKTETIHITGFIGEPGMAQSSRRQQYLFVNGRDVSDPLVSRAVADAYGTLLPGRTWPAFILKIEIAPEEVDVNVHPRKLSVKFLEPNRIYRDMKQAVSQALVEEVAAAGLLRTRVGANFDSVQGARVFKQGALNQPLLEFSENFLQWERGQGELYPVDENGAVGRGAVATPRLLGQLANSYLLVADEEGLAIIDQHAAHERIMYEKLKSRAAARELESQPLLVPITLSCSREESVFLKEASVLLKDLGFELEEWSGGTVVLRAFPAALSRENPEKIFRDFLSDVAEGRGAERILPERILKSLACKSAVKFGMPLARQEQEALLAELAQTHNNATCPHGRPTKVLVNFEDLERRFYRRK